MVDVGLNESEDDQTLRLNCFGWIVFDNQTNQIQLFKFGFD